MSFLGSFLKGVGRAVSGVVGSVPVVGSFLSSGLDSVLNDMDAQDQSNAQIAQSKALMNYQNDLNVKNWTMQNEYNTPAAQLQRLQDAGLNPLAYGLDGNSSGNVPQVAGQSAPDRSSLLNYQILREQQKEQIENLREQRKNLEAQRRGQEIANRVSQAEGDVRIAEAKADLKFGDRTKVPKPDNDHDWKVDDAGYWYYMDGDQKIYSDSTNNGISQRDYEREVEWQRKLNEKEKAYADKIYTEYLAKSQIIKQSIDEFYGIDIASATLKKLLADIAYTEARTDLTNEEKFEIEQDNKIWRELGIGGQSASLIVKMLLHLKKSLD